MLLEKPFFAKRNVQSEGFILPKFQKRDKKKKGTWFPGMFKDHF